MDLEERRHFDSLYPEHKFERRAFIVTSIGAGFALAVQPISAQTITTDSNGLIAGPVKVPVKDGEMPAYRAMPDKEGPFPMILVVHEAWAVHEHIQDICRRLAKVGYCAIAPDLFARYGDVSKMETPAIVQNVMSKVTAEQLAVTGFCFGGGIVWQYAARNHALKTGVAFYGQLSRRFAPDNKSA